MKETFGFFLFGAGLVILIYCVYKDLSPWYWFLATIGIGGGLDLLISGKIEKAKEEIIREIE